MVNTISKTEKQLVDYLENQITHTIGFIKGLERGIDVLNESADYSLPNDVIDTKMEEVKDLRFRLSWLQNQKMVITNQSF